MCDASDYAVGAMLGKNRERLFKVIYYGSKIIMEAQSNCTTTEKKLIAIVFVLDKLKY